MRKQRLREIIQLVQVHVPRAVYKSPVCPSTYTLHCADQGITSASLHSNFYLQTSRNLSLPESPQTGDDYGYRTL